MSAYGSLYDDIENGNVKAVVGENIILPEAGDAKKLSAFELCVEGIGRIISIPIEGKEVFQCEVMPCMPVNARKILMKIRYIVNSEYIEFEHFASARVKIVRKIKKQKEYTIDIDDMTGTVEVVGNFMLDYDGKKLCISSMGDEDNGMLLESVEKQTPIKLYIDDIIEFEDGTKIRLKQRNVLSCEPPKIEPLPLLGLIELTELEERGKGEESEEDWSAGDIDPLAGW